MGYAYRPVRHDRLNALLNTQGAATTYQHTFEQE